MTEIAVALLAGSAVLMFMVGLGMLRRAPNLVEERLGRYGMREKAPTLEEVELEASFYERAIKPLIEKSSKVSARLAPAKSLALTELKLARAGRPHGWTATDFWGIRGLGALLGGGLPFISLLSVNTQPLRLIGLTALFICLGFFMPNFWLDRKIKTRQKDIQKALPDALDLMTVSVEAGLAFDSALQKVSDKWDNELARAFERVTHEMRIGRTRREAMRDLSDRIDVEDVTAFVAAVLQADQLGVSMSKVLRIQSEQMRIRRRQRAEEAAAKAPIKMLFPMVFLIFPSLFIVLLGPAVLILMETFQ